MNDLLLLVGSYAIGCLSAGYYLVKSLKGLDVRQLGSGSTGARNVSRVFGTRGFVLTVLLDAIKGGGTVWIVRAVTESNWIAAASIIAVVCGHIWPVQLRFRGGKGVAPATGGLLIYDPLIALLSAGVFSLGLVAFRNVTLGGLAAVAVSPIVTYVLGRPLEELVLTTALAVLILFAHRTNLRKEFASLRKSHNERKS